MGAPNDGKLVGGARVEPSKTLRLVPLRENKDVHYAVGPLVALVNDIARRVHAKHPGAVLTVGDLSKQGGGAVPRHASHRSGRDVDILFFAADARGKLLKPDTMVRYRADGHAVAWPGAHFDDAANWAIVEALVRSPYAKISRVFVASALRARVLRYALKHHVPPNVLARARALMVQPAHVQPHDDHFHVRIACPRGMSHCVEQPIARHRTPSRKAPRRVARRATPKKPRSPSGLQADRAREADADTSRSGESASEPEPTSVPSGDPTPPRSASAAKSSDHG